MNAIVVSSLLFVAIFAAAASGDEMEDEFRQCCKETNTPNSQQQCAKMAMMLTKDTFTAATELKMADEDETLKLARSDKDALACCKTAGMEKGGEPCLDMCKTEKFRFDAKYFPCTKHLTEAIKCRREAMAM